MKMKEPPQNIVDRLLAISQEALDPSESFSMNRVAAVSGIPRATLYYYFSGKDDLVGFFATWVLKRAADSARAAAAGPGPIPERLEKALLATLSPAKDEPQLNVALAKIFNSSGGLLSRMIEGRDIGYAPIRELLVEGKENGELAIGDVDTTLTAVFGATIMTSLDGLMSSGSADERRIRSVIHLLITGMLPVASRNGSVASVSV